jgi:nucleoside-diphosphate kinase
MTIQQTLILIKPDGIQRGLIGEIIRRIERTGLKIVAMKMLSIDKNFAAKHYFDVGERHGKKILDISVKYLTEGPLVALCVQGIDAINVVRKLVGSTYPNEALPGTIRGDFCHISKDYANKHEKRVGNLIHASSNQEDAKKELALWFSIDELHDYKRTDDSHVL